MGKMCQCESCNGTGTFYFTKDNKKEDSQKCGKCNGTGNVIEE